MIKTTYIVFYNNISAGHIPAFFRFNLKKADMASWNIVIRNNTRCFKSALQYSLDFLFLVLYILADLISFLEIQRLQLAGSSSTVFAANLIFLVSSVIHAWILVDINCKYIVLQAYFMIACHLFFSSMPSNMAANTNHTTLLNNQSAIKNLPKCVSSQISSVR